MHGLQRNNGTTLLMVKGLPDSDGTIVVHSSPTRDYLARMLRDVRGEDFARRWKIVVVCVERDLSALMGLRPLIEVDHAVWDSVSRPVERQLRALADRTNDAMRASR